MDKNPRHGGPPVLETPLLRAASKGHLEVCKLIIQNLHDKNPTTFEGTPLHLAAQEGHLEVCKFIMENTKDKNPQRRNDWTTPLHKGAENGHLEVCDLIIKEIILEINEENACSACLNPFLHGTSYTYPKPGYHNPSLVVV